MSGATAVGPDLVAGISSIRSVTALASVFSQSQAREQPVVAWFDGSAAAAVADLQSLDLLSEVSRSRTSNDDDLRATASGIERGDIELLLVCPPEPSAITAAYSEVAAAAASGLKIRGVAVCPMPRKSDAWPKIIRRAARDHADELAQVLHPIPISRARRGQAPAFSDPGMDVCEQSVVAAANATWVWSITIPGLSRCNVAIGTWSADTAYPTTHVVFDIDGRMIRRQVDSTLRRCEATEAVMSGDSVAITFIPHEGQWPAAEQSGVHDG